MLRPSPRLRPPRVAPRPPLGAPAFQSTNSNWPHFQPEKGPRRLTGFLGGTRIFVWCSRRRLPRPTLTRLLEAPPQSSTDYSEKVGGAYFKVVAHEFLEAAAQPSADMMDDYLVDLLVLVNAEAIASEHRVDISPGTIDGFLKKCTHFYSTK